MLTAMRPIMLLLFLYFALLHGADPPYTPAGYTPIPLSQLPSSFTLFNAVTNQYWASAINPNFDENVPLTDSSHNYGEDQCGSFAVTAASTPLDISADQPSDLFSATGIGTYRFFPTGGDPQSQAIRHCFGVLWESPYFPQIYDYAWQLFLQDGTSDQVLVWNPYPGISNFDSDSWVTDGITPGREQLGLTFATAVTFTIYPPVAATTTSTTTTTTAAPTTITTTSSFPPYTPSGYAPIPLSQLPSSFTLFNPLTNQYWGIGSFNPDFDSSAPLTVPTQNNGEEQCGSFAVAASHTPLDISADQPSDLYSATGIGTYRFFPTGGDPQSQAIRHCFAVLWESPYLPQIYDYAWQLFLQDGTSDQVLVWNPYPGISNFDSDSWVTDGITPGREQLGLTFATAVTYTIYPPIA